MAQESLIIELLRRNQQYRNPGDPVTPDYPRPPDDPNDTIIGNPISASTGDYLVDSSNTLLGWRTVDSSVDYLCDENTIGITDESNETFLII